MIRRPPRSTLSSSSAASDVYKRQVLVGSGLKEQRGFDHRDAMRIALLDLRHPAILPLHDLGMHDGVQLTNAAGKNQVRQLAPIDGAVFIEDFAAKAANHLVIGGSAGCVKLMRESVSLQEMRATLDQHGGDGGFATGDAARQSYAQHWHIRIIEKLKAGTSKSRLALMQYI